MTEPRNGRKEVVRTADLYLEVISLAVELHKFVQSALMGDIKQRVEKLSAHELRSLITWLRYAKAKLRE